MFKTALPVNRRQFARWAVAAAALEAAGAQPSRPVARFARRSPGLDMRPPGKTAVLQASPHFELAGVCEPNEGKCCIWARTS